MCDEVVDDSLAVYRNLFPITLLQWLKKLYTALYADDGLLSFDEDSDDITFCCNEMGILE